jgi:hypothetical protein
LLITEFVIAIVVGGRTAEADGVWTGKADNDKIYIFGGLHPDP